MAWRLAALDVRDEAEAAGVVLVRRDRTDPAGRRPRAEGLILGVPSLTTIALARGQTSAKPRNRRRCLLGRYNGETFLCTARCCIATRNRRATQHVAATACRRSAPLAGDHLRRGAKLGFNLKKMALDACCSVQNRAGSFPAILGQHHQEPDMSRIRLTAWLRLGARPCWPRRRIRTLRLRWRQRRPEQPLHPSGDPSRTAFGRAGRGAVFAGAPSILTITGGTAALPGVFVEPGRAAGRAERRRQHVGAPREQRRGRAVRERHDHVTPAGQTAGSEVTVRPRAAAAGLDHDRPELCAGTRQRRLLGPDRRRDGHVSADRPGSPLPGRSVRFDVVGRAMFIAANQRIPARRWRPRSPSSRTRTAEARVVISVAPSTRRRRSAQLRVTDVTTGQPGDGQFTIAAGH